MRAQNVQYIFKAVIALKIHNIIAVSYNALLNLAELGKDIAKLV